MPGSAILSPYGSVTPNQTRCGLDWALSAQGLSAADLSNALANQNQIIPAGTIKIGDFEYNVKLNNSPDLADELNNLPVKEVNGTTIYHAQTAARMCATAPRPSATRCAWMGITPF